LPAIGCAKTCLIGRYSEPGLKRGSFSYLRDRGRIIGAALRTRDRVAPVFVSVGHQVSLKDSLQIVLGCCAGFRLPGNHPLRRPAGARRCRHDGGWSGEMR